MFRKQEGREGRMLCRGGFTTIELLTSTSIIVVLLMIAAPTIGNWKRDIACRAAAREVASMLRLAKNSTVAHNREHRVEFDVGRQRYGIRAGDRSHNTNWNDTVNVAPVSVWLFLPADLSMSVTVPSIHFNPNGTANPGTIKLLSRKTSREYRIIVSRTGRIRIP